MKKGVATNLIWFVIILVLILFFIGISLYISKQAGERESGLLDYIFGALRK